MGWVIHKNMRYWPWKSKIEIDAWICIQSYDHLINDSGYLYICVVI